MNRLITRFPLAAWLLVGASLVVAIGLGVVVWRADTLMRAFAMERFQQQLRDDSLTLRERIKDFGPVHVEGGKLFAGKAGAAEFQATGRPDLEDHQPRQCDLPWKCPRRFLGSEGGRYPPGWRSSQQSRDH